MNQTTGRDKLVWTIGLFFVLAFALIPVLWLLSLSLKQTPDLTDNNFLPTGGITFDNYSQIFSGDIPFPKYLLNSIGIALIATLISITLGAMCAYAIARLEFPGKFLILAGALAIAMFPPISVVGPLFDMWRRSGSTTPIRPDHPVPDVRPAAGDLHARRVLPEIPWSSSRRRRSTAHRRSRPSAR
jgi:multiple sugar transport system permease protein